MRLKECSTNYHASSLRRKNARQDKPPDSPVRPVRGKKDRKRWCGGHVGREHKPKCFDYLELKHRGRTRTGPAAFPGWKILACTECGKELEHWFPFGKRRERPTPAWVPE